MSAKHLFFQKLVGQLLEEYPRPEAEELAYALIDGFLGLTRLEYWDASESDLSLESQDLHTTLSQAIQKVLRHEPIQYVIGYTHFMDLKLSVDPEVLIPRPETEELVTKIIERERDQSSLKILDIGTGSGCIAIALAKYLSCDKVIATDVSQGALAIAHENASGNQAQVTFEELNILDSPLPYTDLDILVSNPPYVLESDRSTMESNVLDHEPSTALFVPDDDPLLFYRAIAGKALDALKPGGRLYFEIHEAFGKEVKKLLEEVGYQRVEVHADLFLSKDRMIFAKR